MIGPWGPGWGLSESRALFCLGAARQGSQKTLGQVPSWGGCGRDPRGSFEEHDWGPVPWACKSGALTRLRLQTWVQILLPPSRACPLVSS